MLHSAQEVQLPARQRQDEAAYEKAVLEAVAGFYRSRLERYHEYVKEIEPDVLAAAIEVLVRTEQALDQHAGRQVTPAEDVVRNLLVAATCTAYAEVTEGLSRPKTVSDLSQVAMLMRKQRHQYIYMRIGCVCLY